MAIFRRRGLHVASRTRITGLHDKRIYGDGSGEGDTTGLRYQWTVRWSRSTVMQLPQLDHHWRTAETGRWTHAYAAAAKTSHNHTLKTQDGENARPRRYHSPRPTRAGAICSYPQPPSRPCFAVRLPRTQPRGGYALFRACPSRNPRIREAPWPGGKDRMRRGTMTSESVFVFVIDQESV